MRGTHGPPVVALVLLAIVGASCGSAASESSPPEGVTVFAAASLTAAFSEIGDAFMVENPEVAVTFNFAASSELVAQIGEGRRVRVGRSEQHAEVDRRRQQRNRP
jgi:molybdate transport system substrate-binding protein